MNGVSDLFREQMRPRLEEMVIDERRPSNRSTEANLRRVWSQDSEDEQHDLPLPYWADRDRVVQHLIAQRSFRKHGRQKKPRVSGYHETYSGSTDDVGQMDSKRLRAGHFETKQYIGKRSTEEREESDDMSDSNTNIRRMKVRRDETQHRTYHNTPFFRSSNDAAVAYLPRTPSRSRASNSRFQRSSKIGTAMSRKRLPGSPFLGSPSGDARLAAAANPLERLRNSLAAERTDEEARTPFPFAETGGRTFDMDDYPRNDLSISVRAHCQIMIV